MRLLTLSALLTTALLTGCASQAPVTERSPYGVWEGTLPCADCPGIETRLTLYRAPDTYTLTETYLERNGDTTRREGQWEILPPTDPMDLGRISLQGENGQVVRMYRRLPEGGLEMLNRDGERIQSKLNYTLRRKRL
ncbi:copper resistance protein NlpE [Marinobacter halodurans]|uniref:Copper resistance protein NlpE n=1 Tax=Marinobacter halodurans TaxID=2528979 RepID=A0ABY1ZK67_9GAMM|nr:copper resistance protein NlpE [Marinobacter halodurans]TBW55467.1 copper resistance protein NlpE [Marinobacter halodurans]